MRRLFMPERHVGKDKSNIRSAESERIQIGGKPKTRSSQCFRVSSSYPTSRPIHWSREVMIVTS